MAKLEVEAEGLGYKRLYLTTEDSKGLYGWQEIDRVRTPFGHASLMAKDLRRDTRPTRKLNEWRDCRLLRIAGSFGSARRTLSTPSFERTRRTTD